MATEWMKIMKNELTHEHISSISQLGIWESIKMSGHFEWPNIYINSYGVVVRCNASYCFNMPRSQPKRFISMSYPNSNICFMCTNIMCTPFPLSLSRSCLSLWFVFFFFFFFLFVLFFVFVVLCLVNLSLMPLSSTFHTRTRSLTMILSSDRCVHFPFPFRNRSEEKGIK